MSFSRDYGIQNTNAGAFAPAALAARHARAVRGEARRSGHAGRAAAHRPHGRQAAGIGDSADGPDVSKEEGCAWELVKKVVGDGEGEVVGAAVQLAKLVAENSPDSVVVTRESVKLGREAHWGGGREEAGGSDMAAAAECWGEPRGGREGCRGEEEAAVDGVKVVGTSNNAFSVV